jgi:phosphoribosyl 1,2-cyclic phosphodiesterase
MQFHRLLTTGPHASLIRPLFNYHASKLKSLSTSIPLCRVATGFRSSARICSYSMQQRSRFFSSGSSRRRRGSNPGLDGDVVLLAAAAMTLISAGVATAVLDDRLKIRSYDVYVGQPLSLISTKSEEIPSKFRKSVYLEKDPSSIISSSPFPNQAENPKIIFVGSGSSTGCPRPLCALLFPPKQEEEEVLSPELVELRNQYESSCQVSRLAIQGGDPRHNKNYRNNPSIVISHINQDDIMPEPEAMVTEAWKRDLDDNTSGNTETSPMSQIEGSLKPKSLATTLRRKNVIIDVGKTFREGALRWLPPNHIHSLDAIVLTHGHMDSIGGLDDVRGFQKRRRQGDTNTPAVVSTPRPKGGLEPMPVYLNRDTMDAVERQFHYLVPRSSSPELSATPKSGKKTSQCVPPVKRLVAALDYRIIDAFEPFYAAGLKMIPLPVMHGEDMVCLGYAFSLQQPAYLDGDDNTNEIYHPKSVNVVYLSDISRILPETEKYIVNHLPPTDILVLDSLLRVSHNATHQSMREAIDLAKRIGPDKVYLLGMHCDDFLPHDETNELLRQETHARHDNRAGQIDMEVQLASDGLVLDFRDYQ